MSAKDPFSEERDPILWLLLALHIRSILVRARELQITCLIEACVVELDRRPFDFTSSHLADHARQAKEAEHMVLKDATKHAFTRIPATDYETVILIHRLQFRDNLR